MIGTFSVFHGRFVLNGKDYRKEWICERKEGYQELYHNIISKDRKRINKEMKRLEAVKIVILLIEQPSHEIAMIKLKRINYKMNIPAFPTKFRTWLKFRNYERQKAGVLPIKVIYTDKFKAAEVIIKEINSYLVDDCAKNT